MSQSFLEPLHSRDVLLFFFLFLLRGVNYFPVGMGVIPVQLTFSDNKKSGPPILPPPLTLLAVDCFLQVLEPERWICLFGHFSVDFAAATGLGPMFFFNGGWLYPAPPRALVFYFFAMGVAFVVHRQV